MGLVHAEVLLKSPRNAKLGAKGWSLYRRIWYETERMHELLEYRTPHQSLTNGSGT